MNCPKRCIADKARDFTGKGHWSAAGSGNPRKLLFHVAHSPGFMVTRLVFGFSLVNYSDSGSFLVACIHSAKMDSSKKDSGRLVGHVDWSLLSPFPFSFSLLLSQILPVGGSLLVPHSLPEPSLVR